MSVGAAEEAQPVDLAGLAAEAVALVQPLAEPRGVKLIVDRSDQPLLARGERAGLVQILVNILGNAVRHSPEEGVVAILFDRELDRCRVTVADHGPGIALADQGRIFERYERLGNVAEGSGLGLAIALRLARSMQGDITLDSGPGKGARFTLAVPAA